MVQREVLASIHCKDNCSEGLPILESNLSLADGMNQLTRGAMLGP